MPKSRKMPVVGAASETTPEGVAALDRGIAILRSFSIDAPVLSLGELAAHTGLYKSTILRLANSLLHAQLLERLEDGRYRIGPTAFALGAIYRRSITQVEILLPLMRELTDELGESVAFTVRSGKNERTCLIKVLSPRHTIYHNVQEGDRLPCDAGSGGRVLLAFSGEPGETNEKVRATYFYVSIGERDTETSGVSAPVFGPDQTLLGALTISGPKTRFDAAFIARASVRVLQMASQATRSLGGDDTAIDRAGRALLEHPGRHSRRGPSARATPAPAVSQASGR